MTKTGQTPTETMLYHITQNKDSASPYNNLVIKNLNFSHLSCVPLCQEGTTAKFLGLSTVR